MTLLFRPSRMAMAGHGESEAFYRGISGGRQPSTGGIMGDPDHAGLSLIENLRRVGVRVAAGRIDRSLADKQ